MMQSRLCVRERLSAKCAVIWEYRNQQCRNGWLMLSAPTRGLPAAKDLPASEDAKVRELMRRNKLLEQENEVLRRAAAYLSQIHITPPK